MFRGLINEKNDTTVNNGQHVHDSTSFCKNTKKQIL
jgi:hypothetical protein